MSSIFSSFKLWFSPRCHARLEIKLNWSFANCNEHQLFLWMHWIKQNDLCMFYINVTWFQIERVTLIYYAIWRQRRHCPVPERVMVSDGRVITQNATHLTKSRALKCPHNSVKTHVPIDQQQQRHIIIKSLTDWPAVSPIWVLSPGKMPKMD